MGPSAVSNGPITRNCWGFKWTNPQYRKILRIQVDQQKFIL